MKLQKRTYNKLFEKQTELIRIWIRKWHGKFKAGFKDVFDWYQFYNGRFGGLGIWGLINSESPKTVSLVRLDKPSEFSDPKCREFDRV